MAAGAVVTKDVPPGTVSETIDLGEVWTETTGLPFVYAFWAGRPGALGSEEVRTLTHARDEGVPDAGAADRLERVGRGDGPVAAHGDPAGLLGGEEERHVNVVQVDHVEHGSTRRKYLAGLGDSILHAAIPWREQKAVIDVGLDALDGGFSRFHCRTGIDDQGASITQGRLGGGDLGE